MKIIYGIKFKHLKCRIIIRRRKNRINPEKYPHSAGMNPTRRDLAVEIYFSAGGSSRNSKLNRNTKKSRLVCILLYDLWKLKTVRRE